ncbi:MAG: hypothetical protein LC769_12430, partial [Chloroflexi bacterium]|nr:hypothetical protein [Chloroflexota bacterium]
MSATTASVSDPLARDTPPAAAPSGATRPLTDTPRLASERPNSPLLRRLNLFWLVAVVALLVEGGASASHHDPTL